MTTIPRTLAIVTALTVLPTIADAHPGHDGFGFAHGFAHPLLGLDHVLAMLAVGLWAAQLGGRARWIVPASFIGAMSLGGALGAMGFAVPFVEQGILASLMILGVLIASAARLPLSFGAGLVGLFAVFHGFAHASEMPGSDSAAEYGAGFLFATALLHLIGIAAGSLAQSFARTAALRAAGGAIALAGVLLGFQIL